MSGTPELDAALDRLVPRLHALDRALEALRFQIRPGTESKLRALEFRTRILSTIIELEAQWAL